MSDMGDDLMTDRQAEHLRLMGYEPDSLMSKGEASEIIDQLHGDPRAQEIRYYHIQMQDGPLYQDVERGLGVTQLDYDQATREVWEESMVEMARRLGLPDPLFAEQVDQRRRVAQLEITALKAESAGAAGDVFGAILGLVALFYLVLMLSKCSS